MSDMGRGARSSPRPRPSGTVPPMLPQQGQRRPTMRDVAALAGVSLSTVSRVVTGSQQVDPELAVRAAARRLRERARAADV